MSWSVRRQFTYASVTITALLVVIGVPLFVLYYEAPSCFDGKQNGTEVGVDCGGSCQAVCSEQVAPLVVRWSRSFLVTEGNYSAVAYVENPNSKAGVESVAYQFEIFNADNQLIAERRGKTYVSPGTITPVFEPDIRTGTQIPARTFFKFIEEPQWFRAIDTRDHLSVDNKILSGIDTKPRIDATISNNSPVTEFSDIDVVAVIFGTDGNAITASQTVIPLLSPRASQNVVFTWPLPLGKRVESCTAPSDVILLLDTSGSMNDDGGDPPQPITDAKNSALLFVGRLAGEDRSGIVSFATEAELLHVLSFEHAAVGESLKGLSILPEEEQGSTNIGAAIDVALRTFASVSRDEEGEVPTRKVVVLLTDGRANAPQEPGGEEFAQAQALQAKAEGVVIYTIGLGDKVNADFLASIASTRDRYYQAAGSEELDGIYRSISEAICERGPSVIDVIPRTKDAFLLAS